MFEDYRSRVLAAYQEKKAKEELSPNLIDSTPASLKDEFLLLLQGRYLKTDLEALRLIFGNKDGASGYEKAIRTNSADKFKSLNNCFHEKTQEPGRKNTELLAWLIDFQPRPYLYDRNDPAPNRDDQGDTGAKEETPDQYITQRPGADIGSNDMVVEPGGQQKETTITNIPPTGSDIQRKTTWSYNRRNISILLLLLLLASCGSYKLWQYNSAPANTLTGLEKCMYWAEDHYQPVLCDNAIAGVTTIPLEKARATRFRKVTDLGTLTEASVGKVWYLKKDNNVEFFTDTGFHPVFTDRRLRPASRHILDTYAFHAKTPSFRFMGIDIYL